MRQLFRELKRRNVYKVAVAYAAAAFVVVQAARLLVPALLLPDWIYRAVVLAAILGLPIALVIAWAFELTPDGVRRTADAEGTSEPESMSPEERRAQSRLAMTALVGLGLVGAAVAGGWYLMGGGGEPSTETAAPADAASTEPRVGDRSIAVLPFENMGGEESDQFTRGVHDDLLTRLAHVSGLKVISRTAVEAYRDTDLTTGEVADSLGVRWVMEGAVQKMGEQIQVNAQLIDPRTETHAWADRYRRDLTAVNLFDLQSEITKKIARSLEAELTPEEIRQVERRPTEDLDAYKLYVQGRSRLDTRTEEGMREAVDYFQRAIEQDSSYALAWSGLADAVALFQGRGYASPEGTLPDHERTARRALELEPDLAEAHASMGLLYHVQKNAPAALRELKRVVDLKPSYAQAHHWLGWLQIQIGRLEPGHEHLSLAVELNPQHAAAREVLVAALIAQGGLEAAARHLQPLDTPNEPALKAGILYHTRRWDELETLTREQLEEVERGEWRFYLTRIAAFRGDTAAAREQLVELREAEVHGLEGLAHAALGEADEAFSAWKQVEVESWDGLQLVSFRYWYSDILDPLRDDPRYRELIREINQQWRLNPDGSLPDSVDVSFEAQPDE